MLDERSAVILDGHIAILRDNIRILTEQAAEQAGGAAEIARRCYAALSK